MNILQVHTRYRQPGGEDAVVATERSMLEAAGHRVFVHELQNPDDLGSSAVGLLKSPWNRAAAAKVVEAARTFGADVVHVHNTWFALSPAVFPALKEAAFPVVATVHNYRFACVNALLYREGGPCELCLGRMPWRGVALRCYRGSAAQSSAVAVTIATQRVRKTWNRDIDLVVALSDFAVDKLVASGVDSRRIVVKPNFVGDPGSRAVDPSESSTVLFVGRMTEDKGVLDLVEAWETVGASDLEMVMVGDGPLLHEVQTHASRLPNLTAIGSRSSSEVRDLMLGARAIVVPSRWYEGLPMVLLEALAAGLPAVVSNHGALPETVGAAGATFEPGDRLSLASAVGELTSRDDLNRLGEMSRVRYLEKFTPDVGLAMLESVYQRAIETTKGRRAQQSPP